MGARNTVSLSPCACCSEKGEYFCLTNEIRGPTLANEITRNECDDSLVRATPLMLSFSRSDPDDSSARLQKRITGTKISHRPVRRYARVHIPRSDMVRYSVQAFRCAEYNPCVRARARTHTRTRIYTSNSSHSLSFRSLFSGPERPQKSELKRTTQYTRLAFIPGRDKFYREARKHEKCPTSGFKKGICGARCIFRGVRCMYSYDYAF